MNFPIKTFGRNKRFVMKGYRQKNLILEKELIEEGVEALFAPCNHNGYRYCHNNNEILILLWKSYGLLTNRRSTQVQT